MNDQQAVRAVDVVIDVPTARVDAPFTYALTGVAPAVGARVRVSFNGRSVGGWVVSEPIDLPADAALKYIERSDERGPHFTPETVKLAAWLRRRYACTFREALSAVSPRPHAHGAQVRFTFDGMPARGDEIGHALFRRFGRRPFTALAARRELRSQGRRLDFAGVRRELGRLHRGGTLKRIPSVEKKPVRAALRSQQITLVDPSAVKGTAQRRLVELLQAADGSLPLEAARERSGVALAVFRRAAASGAIRLEEIHAQPTSGTPARPPGDGHPTDEQRTAIERLDAAMRAAPTVALLHGVTGSGKTFVYSQLIERLRARGDRAIILVPEISLTPQTAARFAALFGGGVGVLHSGLSDGERARVWADGAQGRLDVVVGARSAVFAPLPDLKLIVVDEEHEPSYKQDVAPRYDAAAVARKRMADCGGSVILGSATPSLESYWEAKRGKMLYMPMERRAMAAPLPPVEIVAMTRERAAAAARPLGPTLVRAIDRALHAGEKVMLFVNRRGYAGLLLCRACGFAPRCRRCAISLVIHSTDGSLRCHICGDAYRIPARCPKCHSEDVSPFGFGTQRVELEVRDLFPSARVIRMDSDTTTTRGSHATLLRMFGEEADVLIGTQMIAKGHDFPTVTLVGVVAADADLQRPDFRASERAFQLLAQVSGRAGRSPAASRVIVQTFSPEHYAIQFAAQHDYNGFARKELDLRRELRYPPFGRLAYLGVTSARLAETARAARELAQQLRIAGRDIDVLGPAPDPRPKARGEYRMRVALKAADEDALLETCGQAQAVKLPRDVRLTVTVDPR